MLLTRQPAFSGRRGGPPPAPAGPTSGEVPQERPQGQLVVGRAPVAARRWVDRGWPTTRQARRSSPRTALGGPPRPAGGGPGSEVSPVQLLQHVDVEGLVGHDLLQPRCSPSRSSLSSLASSAFMPPYWLRQRCQVDSVISRCRTTSSMVLPSPRSFSPSASLRIDLLGRVPPSLHRCAVLLPQSWGIGLAQRVDQFTGTRSLRGRPLVLGVHDIHRHSGSQH